MDRAPRRGPLRALLALALLAAVVGSGALPVRAGPADELARAQAEADAVARAISDLETDLAVLEGEIARLQAEAVVLTAELVELTEQVRAIAVRRYVSIGVAPSPIDDDPLAVLRADAMLAAVADDATATLEAYGEARERLEVTSATLDDRLADQEASRLALTDRLVEVQMELERLGELRRAELQRQAEALAAAREAEAAAEVVRAGAADPADPAGPESATPAPTTTGGPAPAPAPSPPPSPAPTPTTTATAPASDATTSTTSPGPTTTTTVPAPSGGTSTISILCPVQGPSAFVDTWGAPRSGGRTHRGVDMLAPIGTPVVAVVGGRVEHRFNTLGGNSYHLHGNDGNYYYGTHLSAYGAAGQVAAGTVIGYVGDTGNAAGIPHLHFEIHPGGGSAINPYPSVKAACG